ncbi:hypothetical protein [Sphingomonas sp. VL_57B]|jgi:hypothetical protein|uniref:hypothetical protein n=2 Tax=unclassified Sphingomonas TaxID=196159 RepID=UPI0029F21299|nr:hypothetical protein [Pseudomonadota bacterium]
MDFWKFVLCMKMKHGICLISPDVAPGDSSRMRGKMNDTGMSAQFPIARSRRFRHDLAGGGIGLLPNRPGAMRAFRPSRPAAAIAA